MSPTWQCQMSKQPPALFLHRTASNSLRLHRGDERRNVIAHQIELVHVVLFSRMYGDFPRRQLEDQPSLAGVYVWEREDIAQESPVSIRIATEDQYMCADEHPLLLF